MSNNFPNRRRASARVSVPFLAALAAPLAGCGQPVDPADAANTADTAVFDTFTDANQCAQSPRYTKQLCDDFERVAKTDYELNAKHYASKEECRKDSWDCDEQSQPATSQQAQPAATGGSHGGGGYVFFHSYTNSYTPTYNGFSVARPAPGTDAAPVARAVFRKPDFNLATFGGVDGIKGGEIMAAPRANFVSGTTGGTTYSAVSASRPVAVVSARGGFGSSFAAGE